MREWLLVIAPLALILYFLTFPDQLSILSNWLIQTTN